MPAPITSMNSFLKQQQLKLSAQQRMKNYTGGTADEKANRLVKEMKQLETSNRIGAIAGRLKAGKKLSGADLAFLRKHAPELYGKAIQIVKEREAYRRRMEKAKTKDEAARIQQEKQQQLSLETKQKGADPEFLLMRSSAILDEHTSYLAKGNYSKLKWESGIRLEKAKEQKAEEKRIAEKLAEKDLAEERKADSERTASQEPKSPDKPKPNIISAYVRAKAQAAVLVGGLQPDSISSLAPSPAKPAASTATSAKPAAPAMPAPSGEHRQKAVGSYVAARRLGEDVTAQSAKGKKKS